MSDATDNRFYREKEQPSSKQDTEALSWSLKVHEDLAEYVAKGGGNMLHCRANRALEILFAEVERLEKILYPLGQDTEEEENARWRKQVGLPPEPSALHAAAKAVDEAVAHSSNPEDWFEPLAALHHVLNGTTPPAVEQPHWVKRRAAQPPSAALPINSAPRTGKRILLWAAIVGTPGKWVTGRYSCDAYRTINDIVIGAEEGFQCDGDECIPSNQEVFTHWRPLPGEPETKPAAPVVRVWDCIGCAERYVDAPQTYCERCQERHKKIADETNAPQCWCHNCNKSRVDGVTGLPWISSRMIVCPDCGNKRCPKANEHTLACTNSNEPGQPGSAYP